MMDMKGLRQRKKIQTRNTIASAALTLFHERGYDHVTIDDIAAEADVSVRTLFRYYPDKQEIVFADSDTTRDFLVAALLGRPSNERAARALLEALTALIPGWQQHKPEGRQRQEAIEGSAQLMAREHVKHAAYAEALTPALSQRGLGLATAALLAQAGISCFHSATRDWLFDQSAKPEDYQRRFRRQFADLAEALQSVTSKGESKG